MAIIYLTRFPERPAPPSTAFRSRVRPEQVFWAAENGAGWGWVRLLPEGFFPHSREKRAGNPPSALSCTTWGFSCGSAYANARWALTPPFHPYPAPLWVGRRSGIELPGRAKSGAGRYIFCDTVRHPGFHLPGAPDFTGHAAFRCSDFPLAKQESSQRSPATIDRIARSEVECQSATRDFWRGSSGSASLPRRLDVGHIIRTAPRAQGLLF